MEVGMDPKMAGQAVDLGRRMALVSDPTLTQVLADGVTFISSLIVYGTVKVKGDDGEMRGVTYEEAVATVLDAAGMFRGIIAELDAEQSESEQE